MKSFAAFLLLILCSMSLYTQTGIELREQLRSEYYVDLFNDLGYSDARQEMFGFVDIDNGNIYCVYSGWSQAGGFVTFPDPINTEHVVPQSFYGQASPMRSDLHNIRPCHQSANSSRGNSPFGNVISPSNWYGIDSQGNYENRSSAPTNPDAYSKRGQGFFEPRDSNKGNIARQVFYFYTMYPSEAGDIDMVADINVLYQWHMDDPVDTTEMLRNDRIEIVQGNRNPYIDDASLVSDAWIAETDILGCTYELALNYSTAATLDDGSCAFGVLGCTYFNASNYNPEADLDNGSCEFTSTCEDDLNGDGLINITDLITLVSRLGQVCP